MTTLNDIARMAGVSKSTVSRFFNQGQVSAETRDRIQQVVDATNYQPNNLARSLKARSTDLIGVVLPRFDSASVVKVMGGIDSVAHHHHQQLLIVNADLDPDRELAHIYALDKQRVDAIIVFTRNEEEALLRVSREIDAHLIVLGQDYDDLAYVAYDDYGAGQKVAQYLQDLGHQDVLYVNVDGSDPAVGQERLQGFKDGLDKFDGKLEIIRSSFQRSANYDLALEILPKTSAAYVICATDRMAIAFLKAAQELNIRIPEDLSISGFGGYSEGRFVHPTLTTVTYPYEEAGRQAMELALDLVKGTPCKIHVVLPTELETGHSTRSLKNHS